MSIFHLFRDNKKFFIAYFFLMLIAIFILLFFSKKDAFFLLNPYHTTLLNSLFIGITWLGDGIFVIAVAIILFFFKKKFLSGMVLGSYFLSGIIAQVLKYFVTEARPAYFLSNAVYPHFIEGVTLHNYHSFPSGHTASAFALAAVLSFFTANKNYSFIFLIVAASVGYSRIYLGQHFLDDVLAGSVIGVFSSAVCWIYLKSFLHNKLKLK